MNRNLHARTLALSVAAVLAACGSSSKTSPPPPPLGTATIKALGGAGSAGSGGAGGAVTITGQGGGKVEVLTHGEVDASFSYAVSPPELGGNPKTVSSDATLTVDPFGRLLGDDGVSPATGLHVAASATLTVAPRAPRDRPVGWTSTPPAWSSPPAGRSTPTVSPAPERAGGAGARGGAH